MAENLENPQFKKIHKLKRFSQFNYSDFVNDLIATKTSSQHLDAFDIGGADYYYGRKMEPNLKTRVLNPITNKYENQIITKSNMTQEDINKYYMGYYYWKYIVQTKK